MADHHAPLAAPGKYISSNRTKTIYSTAILIGVIGFAAALYNDQSRAWHSFLTSFFYFTNLALGGMFFVAVNHAAKSGWNVTIRRFSEAMSSFIPVAAIGAIVLLFGAKSIYTWLNPELVAHDPTLLGKSSYLNMGFFAVRTVIFFAAWIVFQKLIIGNSLQQDRDGDEKHTVKNVALSVGFLLVFAISFSLFSVDTTMSLQPHWYSTMWGVYCFAGLFQSSLAALVIFVIATMHKGVVRGYVNDEHLHDIGKYLKGFTVFYAYIGFSQFLLIWYANLPEETIFFLSRSTGGWMGVTLSLLIFKFIVPFMLLLPRAAKRTHGHLILVATLILVMQYVEDHWIIYPSLVNGDFDKYGGRWIFGWQEIAPFLMFGGLFVWRITDFLSKQNVVPIRDPRIQEALNHHVTY